MNKKPKNELAEAELRRRILKKLDEAAFILREVRKQLEKLLKQEKRPSIFPIKFRDGEAKMKGGE